MPWVQDTRPFLVSPDGSQLLIKTDTDDGGVATHVEDLATGVRAGLLEGDHPLLIAWRPKSSMISYVTDNRGDQNFRLKLWNLATNKVVTPDVPGMSWANRLMRWSPDGQYLAFRVPKKPNGAQLWLLDAITFAVEPIFEEGAIPDHGWSPDGDRLAVARDDSVVLIDRLTRQRRSIAVCPGGEVNHLAWRPDGRRLLVTARETPLASLELREVDTESGIVRALSLPEGDATRPVAMTDGRIMCHVTRDAMSHLMLGGPEGFQPFGFTEGSTTLLTIDEGRRFAWVDHTGLSQPRGLYRIGLDDGRAERIFPRQMFPEEGRGVAPTRVELSLSDGTALPIHVWRAGSGPSRGVVIKFPTPGYPPVLTFDGGNQFLLSQGYDLIAFDFPPEDASDATDRVKSAQRALLAGLVVVNFARDTMKAPPDRVVMFGVSAGAMYLAQVASVMPDKRGWLVFRGILPSVRHIHQPAHGFGVIALHGENEAFAPAQAKALVEEAFGADRLKLWHVLKHEGHAVRRVRSRGEIAAALFHALEAHQAGVFQARGADAVHRQN